jgi:hypothetical protein
MYTTPYEGQREFVQMVRQAGYAADKWKEEKSANYCNASNKRVIVRFKSLSDRRISSILLIECSTVV